MVDEVRLPVQLALSQSAKNSGLPSCVEVSTHDEYANAVKDGYAPYPPYDAALAAGVAYEVAPAGVNAEPSYQQLQSEVAELTAMVKELAAQGKGKGKGKGKSEPEPEQAPVSDK